MHYTHFHTLYTTQAVARGAKRALIVGDMPFGSYEVTAEAALTNAFRFVKEVTNAVMMMTCVLFFLGRRKIHPSRDPVRCTAFYCTLIHNALKSRGASRIRAHWMYVYIQGFVDAVKIEGGRDRASTVRKIVKGSRSFRFWSIALSRFFKEPLRTQ